MKTTQHYIFIENGTLGYATSQASGNTTTFSCPGKYVLSDWTNLLVLVEQRKINYHDRRLEVSLSTKSLDKTSSLKKLACHEGNVKNNQNLASDTIQAKLGRGYAGQLTPIFIDKFTSERESIRMIACMRHSDVSACRRHSRVSASSYLSNIEYEIDSKFSIRREIETEIGVMFNSDYECMDRKVHVSIDPHYFRIPEPSSQSERYYDRSWGYRNRVIVTYPANLTLGSTAEEACNLAWDNGNFTITNVSLSECGFQADKIGNTTTLYHNTIFMKTNKSQLKLMDIACWYTPRPVMREEVSLAAYTVHQIHRETSHSFSPWKMSLVMFKDGNFNQKLENPVKLMGLEKVFVEGRVESDIDVELVIESCKTRVVLNQHSTLENVLIEGSKPTSADVSFQNSTSSFSRRFVFKATIFEDQPNAVVHLSCVMTAKQKSADVTA